MQKKKKKEKIPYIVFKLFRDKVPYFTQYYRNYEHSLGCGKTEIRIHVHTAIKFMMPKKSKNGFIAHCAKIDFMRAVFMSSNCVYCYWLSL